MNRAHTTLASSGLILASMLLSTSAMATGVTAGTLIQNTASASYDSGPTSTTVQSNTVTVKVDELLNVTTASLDSGPKTADAAPAVLTFSVTNTGNGSEAFKLTADGAVSGNAFAGTIDTVAIDSNGNGVYDPGIDTVIANGALSPALAADGVIKVFVVVSLPAGTADGALAQVRLTAVAGTGSGTPGTTFAAAGDAGVDAVVGATTATSNALGSVVARLAGVTLTKSFTIADPFGGTQTVPGAVVTYKLKADVGGTGNVQNLRITDVIPTGTSYVASSLKLEGAGLTDAVDADAGKASSAGVDVALGTIAGGTSRSVTFQVKIN